MSGLLPGVRYPRALDPKYALARHWCGEFLGLMGRYDEAITQLRLAIDLEPPAPGLRVH